MHVPQPDRTRCGYLIKHSEHYLTDEPGMYRLSRDGWFCYQTPAEMAELDSLSDGDFEALLSGMRALTRLDAGE